MVVYKEYKRIKEKYSSCVVLIRVGNFYQTFDDDGIILNYLLRFIYQAMTKKSLLLLYFQHNRIFHHCTKVYFPFQPYNFHIEDTFLQMASART